MEEIARHRLLYLRPSDKILTQGFLISKSMHHNDGHIRFLTKEEIDKQKWDHLIESASNAHIYSTRLYLNLFTVNWGALVYGDYQVVMVVPYKVKFGIRYTYTPVGIAQLGLIGERVDEKMEMHFIETLHKHFKYGMLHLNPSFSKKNAEAYKMKWKTNFVLSLNQDYESLSKNYTKDARRNLRAASEIVQQVSFEVDTEEIKEAFMQQYGKRGNTEKLAVEYAVFARNLEILCDQKMAFKMAVRTEGGELLGAGVFAHFKGRLYYVFGAPTALGRANQTTHVLIDAIIRKFAGTNTILDFEGSSIPSVAMFYKKFSPIDEPYPFYRFNHLPTILRLFKA